MFLLYKINPSNQQITKKAAIFQSNGKIAAFLVDRLGANNQHFPVWVSCF
jgi:hypothetical protein